MAITEERPTEGECPRIQKRPYYLPGHAQRCVTTQSTEYAPVEKNSDLSSSRTVGVGLLHHKPAPRESDNDTCQPLPPAES